MAFRVGDKVRFLDQVGEGIVRSVLSVTEVMVEDETGFEYPYPIKQLVAVADKRSEMEAYRSSDPGVREIMVRNSDAREIKKVEADFNSKYRHPESLHVRKKADVIEIDLHIHALVDTAAGLDPSAILAIQMEHFDRMMKMAEERKFKRVVLIHGIGEGVLRAELRKCLHQFFPNARYHDADFRIYGQGATEVILRRQ